MPVSELDLKLFLEFCFLVISFRRYTGPIWCTHLYVRMRILKPILCLIGSQCGSLRAWVALSNLDLLSTKHAHMFWIRWRLFIEVAGNPYSTELQ